MSYRTRQEAIDKWVPSGAMLIYNNTNQEVVVYAYNYHVHVLRVFPTRNTRSVNESGFMSTQLTWHVSEDVRVEITEIQEATL